MLPIKLIGISGLSRTYKVSPRWPWSSPTRRLSDIFRKMIRSLSASQYRRGESQLRQTHGGGGGGYVQTRSYLSAIMLQLKISREEKKISVRQFPQRAVLR